VTVRREITLEPRGRLVGRVHVPPSKSHTHRALVLASLAEGRTAVVDPLIATDTARTIGALRALGVAIGPEGPEARAVDRAIRGELAGEPWSFARKSGDEAPVLAVAGCGGRIPAGGVRLDVGACGTTMRLLCALACLAEGEVKLDGDARMRERPIGPLIDALGALGARARYLRREGFPPVALGGAG
jgi:3-phosphoshikimate 1-carboxyvinyltransferase